MMQHTIRTIQKSDLDSVVALCAEHAVYEKTHYQALGKAELLARMLFCQHPQLHGLVAEIENEIIGYTTFSRECSTWNASFYVHLDCLFLKEDYRGLGIGRALIKQVLAYATQIKASHIEWQTPVFNHRAIKFYNRIGATSKEKLRFTLTL